MKRALSCNGESLERALKYDAFVTWQTRMKEVVGSLLLTGSRAMHRHYDLNFTPVVTPTADK